MTSSSQAQSFCVDGDIKYAADDSDAAAVSYLHAHMLDPAATRAHMASLAPKQAQQLAAILQEWLKPKDEAKSDKSKLGVMATPDQIWEFIFFLEPEAVTTCFARVDSLLREKRYQQVIDSCTAILKQYPQETAPILLQRGLARTLLGDQDKEAIADYLRAYLKDKDVTLQVVRNKQGEHIKSVMNLMRNCVHSKHPSVTDAKAHKQWLALTIDCCRFLLTFEPNDFALQMTFVERLKAMHKTDRAITMLNETLDVLHLDEKPDAAKVTEALLRRGACYIAKQHVEKAVSDITAGLNASNDALIRQNTRSNGDNELFFLDNDNKPTLSLAREIFGGKASDLSDLYVLLDKTASKLSAEDKYKTVTKMDNIRTCADLYRALLVIQPGSKDATFKLASCYAKLGKNKQAVRMFDKMVEDPYFANDSAVLSARAACHRELGDKAQAQKDYNALLHNNPRDVILLCERAMVYMEDGDIKSLVEDLLLASRINQKQTIVQLNKELLVQRTRTRQVIFDYAKSLLQDAPLPQRVGARSDASSVDDVINSNDDSTSSVALSLAQLLTRLNPADQSAHILMAHAMFHSGCTNDAETKLKKMLQENSQTVDVHVVKLHLGLMKIFTKRIDEGMTALIEVLSGKGERVVSVLLRDIPISERAHLADESHQFGIELLQKNRDMTTVKQAIGCFTIAILSCRGTDLVLEEPSAMPWLLLPGAKCLAGIKQKSDKLSSSAWSLASSLASTFSLRQNAKSDAIKPWPSYHLRKARLRSLNGGTGVYRSYLARAECMAHTGDQRAAILDFSAAIEVNSSCVEGLCGRAFMRLALGDETDCVNDLTVASDLDLYTVVAHIHALPPEARKLLLFWIDHRVVVLLLNYGYKATSGERISTGGSASTISMVDETAGKPGHNQGSRRSSLSSIHPPSTVSIREETQEELQREENDVSPGRRHDDVTPTTENATVAANGEEEKKGLHKSESSTRDLKEALLTLDAAYDSQLKQRKLQRQKQNSRGSTATTVTSVSTYDDVISAMEKAEILQKAMVLGRLLISVEENNVTWHGMYADILIVKGDFDEALRHLHVVMELNPNDVTAVARAGLINVKMNRYHVATVLLRSLCGVDRSGLVYVLKALDQTRRRRLADESLNHAEEFSREGKFAEARDAYSLSLFADSAFKAEKLRKRSRCQAKVGDTGRAINDISEVIKDTAKRPQASDFCSRAAFYLMEGKESHACRDYAAALNIDRNQTLTLIQAKPGRTSLCEIFYRQASEAFAHHSFQECHDLCEVSLTVDDSDIPTRKLRARAKREISKCVVQ